MMLKLSLLSCLIAATADACMPTNSGSGELQPYDVLSTPKFQLAYSPPTGWTVSPQQPTQGQAKDANEAQNRAMEALNNAFKDAFTKISAIVPGDYKLNTAEMIPISLVLSSSPDSAKNGEGIVELGVVSQVCMPQGTATDCANGDGLAPLTLNQTVYVENGPLLNGAQWNDVADQVFIKLSSESGVYFQEELVPLKN